MDALMCPRIHRQSTLFVKVCNSGFGLHDQPMITIAPGSFPSDSQKLNLHVTCLGGNMIPECKHKTALFLDVKASKTSLSCSLGPPLRAQSVLSLFECYWHVESVPYQIAYG